MTIRITRDVRLGGARVAPGAVLDLAAAAEVELLGLGSAVMANPAAWGTPIFGPDVSYAAPTIVAGAGVTVASHGLVAVGDEVWYEVTATGISGTNNNYEIQWSGLPAFSADSASAEWQVVSGLVGSVSYYLGTAGYAAFVNYGNSLSAYSTTQPFNHRGRNGMCVYESQWAKSGFTGKTTQLACVVAKIRVVIPNGTTTVFRLRAFRAGIKHGVGRVAVVFDDGYQSTVRLGLPICQQYGVPVTMAVVYDTVGTGGVFATLADLKRARALGVECVAHGAQQMFGAGLTTDAARLADIRANIAFVRDNNLGGPAAEKCYVWPNGMYCATGDEGNPALLDAIRAQGITIGRSASPTNLMVQLDALSPTCDQRLLMPVVGHTYQGVAATADDATETTNISTIVSRIQAAAAQRADVFLMLHKVVGRGATTGGVGTIEIEADRLDTLMSAIRAEVAAGTLEAVHMSAFA